MAEKTLNTRILLKYDTLANWQTKNTLLKQGEVAFVQIGEVTTDQNGNRVIPPVMFKVGPGNFNSLGWGAATAADVYSWAKQENLPVVRNDAEGQTAGNVISSVAWDSINNRVVYTTASVATSEGMAELQEALEGLTNTVNGMYTNEQIDAAIAEAKSGAETTAANALATARTEISAEIDADVKVLADGAVKANADAIEAIKADYLKAADLDDLNEAIESLNGKVDLVEGSTVSQAIFNAVSEVRGEAQGYANTAEQNAKNYADQIKEDLLGTEELNGTYDTLKEIGAWIESSGVDATELADAIAVETKAREDGDKAINDTLATYGDIVTHDASEFQAAGDYEAAGAAAQALAEAKADTTAQINALNLADTYEAKGAAETLANGAVKANTEAIAAINNETNGILAQAKAYADANDADTTYTAAADGGLKLTGTEFAIDESITFILDCGGAE